MILTMIIMKMRMTMTLTMATATTMKQISDDGGENDDDPFCTQGE